MFERFTERARQVVVLAQDEARELGHNYIGTEHLLLGLIREEEGIGAKVIGELGVSLEAVRAHVRAKAGTGEPISAGQIPFTPRAKRVLELALREALALGHNFIGTEHVLLGLSRDDGGVACEILHELSVDEETIRSTVIAALGGNRVVAVGAGYPRGVPWQVRARRPRPVLVRSAPWPRQEDIPRRRSVSQIEMFVLAWALSALTLGAGIVIGWAIWH